MIWQTPSGQAFAAEALDSLSAGKNAALVVPKPLIGMPLINAVSEGLRQKGLRPMHAFDLSAADLPAGTPFADFGLPAVILAAWNWEDEWHCPVFGSRSLLSDIYGELARDRSLKFLALTGVDSLPRERQAALFKGVSEWSALTQQSRHDHLEHVGLRIVLLVPPSEHELRSDLFLEHRVFWGRIHAGDLEWAFRRLETQFQAESPAEYLFLKALCLGLCVEDFPLMKTIVTRQPKSLEDLEAILEKHPLRAVARKLSRTCPPPRPGLHPSLNRGNPPPKPTSLEEIRLWSEGLMWAGASAGLHPAIMDREELERAVAAAQRDVFLPVVDHAHTLLVSALELAFGEGMWEQMVHDPARREDIRSEISPLAFFIKKDLRPDYQFSYNAKRAAEECAFSWRRIRNETAHNRPVAFHEISRAFSEYANFRARVYEPLARKLGHPRHALAARA
ncbi:MAG: hypothetical protein LBW85_04790 [Deltaproteobacteria bacterium]|jgi:hypothetical protein|nr:hypothetical protein [Deltaproteobacteria bacterium]